MSFTYHEGKITDLPRGELILVNVTPVGFLPWGAAVGRIFHQPEVSRDDAKSSFHLPDGTDVTALVEDRSAESLPARQELWRQGVTYRCEPLGRRTVLRAAVTEFHGEHIGSAEILGYWDLPSDLPLEDFTNLPEQQGVERRSRPFLVKMRRDDAHPFPEWQVAEMMRSKIRFRQGGVDLRDAGQMSRLEGWCELPSEVLETWRLNSHTR